MDKHRKLLFICTGNYYRSRYAELYFNARSAELGAGWRAESRGLRLSPANLGPIAPCVLERLTTRTVSHPPASRFPLQLREHDLVGAERIIALDEDEHRPLARALFPPWSDRIAYWRIPDLDRLGSQAALDAIEREVERLIQDLLQLYRPSDKDPDDRIDDRQPTTDDRRPISIFGGRWSVVGGLSLILF